ncbi:MAG: ABC transporter substrate-binding protein [Phycisphaerae bacterium]
MTRRLPTILLILIALLCGCGGDSGVDDPRRDAVDAAVREKYGMSLDELPVLNLQVISPHHESIQNEFEWAFSLWHAEHYGKRVRIEWRDVGGGSSTINTYLSNIYARRDTADIDVLWGGGEFVFRGLAADGLLEEMDLPAEILEQIPANWGGQQMMDRKQRWIGSAVSGFGFIYNRELLDRCEIDPPVAWDDLADGRFSDLISLADPSQSGSAAAAYQMIARSGHTWPEGWAKLMMVLSNAKRFNDSAGSAANAPLLGEALVATCIDFYGAIRVAEAPEVMVYVSPKGQTTFTPDPIGILKNPPKPELARRFVRYVLSRQGQMLWSGRVGAEHGPARFPLGRQPIRRDAYDRPAENTLPWIVNPYRKGQSMQLEGHRAKVDYGVLRQLVWAAAVSNREDMQAARKTLNAMKRDPDRRDIYRAKLERFVALPPDVATLEAMAETKQRMKDDDEARKIVLNWQAFFRETFQQVAGE